MGHIILPRPAWGRPPSSGRRRRLSALLAGRGAFTFGDIGGCACGCNGHPCSVPTSDTPLTVSFAVAGTPTSTWTMAYVSGCLWRGCGITTSGASSVLLTFVSAAACSYFSVQPFGNSTCSGAPSGRLLWESAAGCSGLSSTQTLHLSTGWSCSPLSITWNDSPGSRTWTLTF